MSGGYDTEVSYKLKAVLRHFYCFVSTKFNDCIIIQIFGENPINNGPLSFKNCGPGEQNERQV